MDGWVAIYLKSNYVPEILSFSKIYSEMSFSSCKFFFDRRTDRQMDRQTDRRTDKPTYRSSFPELKNEGRGSWAKLSQAWTWA